MNVVDKIEKRLVETKIQSEQNTFFDDLLSVGMMEWSWNDGTMNRGTIWKNRVVFDNSIDQIENLF